MIHVNFSERVEAENRYREFRRQARETVMETLLPAYPDVSLTDINHEALAQAETWRNHYPLLKHSFVPGWSWQKIVTKFRRRPRRLEVALWHDTTLCGIAIGRISDACVVATIHYVESLPMANPLQGHVLPIIVRYLEALASHRGCNVVTIEHPVPELLPYYAELGFTSAVLKGKQVIRLRKHLASIPVEDTRTE